MRARGPLQTIEGIGSRLSERLRALHLTQTDLALKAGISRQTLYRVLRRDEVSASVAKRIASVVGSDLLSSSISLSVPISTKKGSRTFLENRNSEQTRKGPLSSTGLVLELIRKDAGDTQEEMARAAGISLRTYRRVISGTTRLKDPWLIKWGEINGLSDPASMIRLKDFELPDDPLNRALGDQIHAWRVTAGLDLLDVADAIGVSAVDVAMMEVGAEENLVFLDDLAPLFGTTSDVLFRAASLATPRDKDWRPPVERVFTFEAAQRSAQAAERNREHEREHGGWDLEAAFELSLIRARAGFDTEDVSKRLKRPNKLIQSWEDGAREPKPEDFERMAVLYRSTPWELRYGKSWARALAFPNARESRSAIFAAIWPRSIRSWLYQYLGELAEIGLDDIELAGVRESLANPDLYYDLWFAKTPAESTAFLKAKLRELAEETWRNITTPGWIDAEEMKSLPKLPPVFDDRTFNARDAAVLVAELGSRRATASARLYSEDRRDALTKKSEYPSERAFLSNPFSYYEPRITPASSDKSPDASSNARK